MRKQDDCTLCPLRQEARQVVWGRGPQETLIAVYAEAPGQEEDRFGYPLVGPSGYITEQMLTSINIDPETVYYSNVVKCRPMDNRTPNKPEIKVCTGHHLQKEIEGLENLKWIWTFGKTAYYGIHKKDCKITQELGKVEEIQIGDRTIKTLLLFHPSYLMRNPSLDPGGAKEKQWKALVNWQQQHWSKRP